MQLTDHIQHLLRDHDCVIIPDFGGLIADYEPARLHPVRHTLAPPAKRVAFNQALTRNDGLLVDAIGKHYQLEEPQARQQVRAAVQRMQQELDEQQRTELPGIGVFRQAPGRGLDFEYTGNQNLLPASYGLPELTSRPVRATDALLARERIHQAPSPALASARRNTMRKLFSGVLGAGIVGLVLSANLQFAQQVGYWPKEWWPNKPAEAAVAPKVQPQAAALAAHDWPEETVPDGTPAEAPAISKPAEAAKPAVAPAAAKPATATKAAAKSWTGKAAKKAWTAKKAATPAKPAASVAAAPKAVAPKAAVTATTISGVTNRYYVVVGSFNTLRSAERARLNIARRGKTAHVLMPRRGTMQVRGTRYFRLAVADFADYNSAARSLPALRQQHGKDILVLNY